MSDTKTVGIQITNIETAAIYACQPVSQEALALRSEGGEVGLSASYTISIDPEPIAENEYLARVHFDLLFGSEKERFVASGIVVTFSGITDILGMPESEKAALVAKEAFPYARSKVCSLLTEIGLPADLPYYPPEFVLKTTEP